MRRSLHCTFDALKQVVDQVQNQGAWQIKALQAFDLIKVRVEKDPVDSLDSYISIMSGDVEPCEVIPYEQKCIWGWNNVVGKKIISYKGVDSFDLEQAPNDVFTKDVFQVRTSIPSGVFVMDTLDFNPLMRNWPKDTKKEKRFNWDDLFRKSRPIPTSNAMVLIDRYIFNSNAYINGAKNIANILKNTIPDDFTGEYQLLIIFGKAQIEGKKQDSKICDSITDAIFEIDNIIRQRVIDKLSSLRIEYLSVEKVTKGDYKMAPSQKEKTMRRKKYELYELSHDRKLITSYYNVKATKAFNAINYDDSTYPKASERQELNFKAILCGVDNSDCDFCDIPLNSAKRDIISLAKYIKGIDTLSCFSTTSEDPKPQEIKSYEIKNRLLY